MTKTLAGTLVPVPASGLFASTLQVVLLPILGGLALKRWFPDAVKKATPFCPPFAVATVALVCSSVIGSSSAAIASAGGALIAAVATLHACGFALGYGVACALVSGPDRRTVSIEVGMQNRRSALSQGDGALRGSARGGAVRDIGDGALVPGERAGGDVARVGRWEERGVKVV